LGNGILATNFYVGAIHRLLVNMELPLKDVTFYYLLTLQNVKRQEDRPQLLWVT